MPNYTDKNENKIILKLIIKKNCANKKRVIFVALFLYECSIFIAAFFFNRAIKYTVLLY